jgi:hypothetical protein
MDNKLMVDAYAYSTYYIENDLDYDLSSDTVFHSEYNYIREYKYLGKSFSIDIKKGDMTLIGSDGGLGCETAIPPHINIDHIDLKSVFLNNGEKMEININENTNWKKIETQGSYEYVLMIDENFLDQYEIKK